jgi:hypothetical protein
MLWFSIFSRDLLSNSLLVLVFVSNPTLVKSSVNVPGISDHEIIKTDFETKVHHQKTTPRKCYIYSKDNWNTINKDLNTLNAFFLELSIVGPFISFSCLFV